MKNEIKIGCINYLNFSPFYNQLSKNLNDKLPFKFVSGDPVTLYDMFKKGLLDITPVSSVCARDDSFTRTVPNIGLSSTGKVESVILLTSKPLCKGIPQKIAVTKESKTSFALLKVLFKDHKEIVYFNDKDPFKKLGKKADGALLIGDKALRVSIELKERLHNFEILDLGLLWYEMTYLPMVWACWIAKKDLPNDLSLLLEKMLNESALSSHNDLLELAKDTGENSISKRHLLAYWKRFNYFLDPSSIKGLERFQELAKNMFS